MYMFTAHDNYVSTRYGQRRAVLLISDSDRRLLDSDEAWLELSATQQYTGLH